MIKKILAIILCIVITFITIGITFSVYASPINFRGIINGYIDVELIDEYIKPAFVHANDRISKVVSAKNTGTVDQYVRIQLEKYWCKDGVKREDLSDENIIINFKNPDLWVKGNGGYYYYQKKLLPNEKAENLMENFDISSNFNYDIYGGVEGKIVVFAEAIQDGIFEPIYDEENKIINWHEVTNKSEIVVDENERSDDEKTGDKSYRLIYLNLLISFIILIIITKKYLQKGSAKSL